MRTLEHRKKMRRVVNRGPNHYRWKGGLGNVKFILLKKERLAGRPKATECDICGSPKQIEFEHDHKTGQFRGWTCHMCNWIIGLVNDDPKRLVAIAKYLVKASNGDDTKFWQSLP